MLGPVPFFLKFFFFAGGHLAGSGTAGERELAEALRGGSRAVAIPGPFRTALPHGTAEQGLRKGLDRGRCCNNSESFTYEKTTHRAVQPGDRKALQLTGEQGNLCGKEGKGPMAEFLFLLWRERSTAALAC